MLTVAVACDSDARVGNADDTTRMPENCGGDKGCRLSETRFKHKEVPVAGHLFVRHEENDLLENRRARHRVVDHRARRLLVDRAAVVTRKRTLTGAANRQRLGMDVVASQ